MPLYEFSCKECGFIFEEIINSDFHTPACPQCGAQNTQKQISMPSPLKTGAFPFKPGPVHPLANKMAAGCHNGCSCGSQDRDKI